MRRFEGGIAYEVTPDTEPPEQFWEFVYSIPCTCAGEVHDECVPREEEE